MEVHSLIVAAHEMQAPLYLLRQLALGLDLAKTESERIELQAEMIHLSEQALAQVQDLTKIAQLETEPLELGPVAVRSVCQRAVQDLLPQFQSAKRRLRLEFSSRARLAIADTDLLYSVVTHLCYNALQYSSDSTASRLIISQQAGRIQIRVRDYGPALPLEIWQKLQTGSFTAPARIALRSSASGLGLFIASQFAKFLQSDLRAIRHRDGASLYFSLPISQQVSLL